MKRHFYTRVILIGLILANVGESKTFPEIIMQNSPSNINAVEILNSSESKLPEKPVKTEGTSDIAMFKASLRSLFPSNENHNLNANWLHGGDSAQKRLIRCKRWFWRSNRNAERARLRFRKLTTTQKPKRSGWMPWFFNAAVSVKKTYKRAKEKFKRRFKKVGRKIGRGFARIRHYFTRSEDKFEVFVHKVQERVDQGDEKAVDLLNKLGIEVNYNNDGKPIGSAVSETAKDVKEILENRGIYFPGNETVQEPAVQPGKNLSSETTRSPTTQPSSTFISTPYFFKTSPFSKTIPYAIPSEITTFFLNGSEKPLTENLSTRDITAESQSNATSIFSQPTIIETTTPPITALSFSPATISTLPLLGILFETMKTKLPHSTTTPSPLETTLLPNIGTHSTLQTKTLPTMASKPSLTSTLPPMTISSPFTIQPKSTTSSINLTVQPKKDTTIPPITTTSSSPTTTSSAPFSVPPMMWTKLPPQNISSTIMTTTQRPSTDTFISPPTTTELPQTITYPSSKILSTIRQATTSIIITALSTTNMNSSVPLTTHTAPITHLPTTNAKTSPIAPIATRPEQTSTTTITPESVSTTTSPKPISTRTTTPEQTFTTNTRGPRSTTTLKPEPTSTTTTIGEPISTTTTTLEPPSTTTLIPTTTESTEPPPFPDIFGDSVVRDRLHEVFLHGDFSHDELRSTFEFDPALYEDYYHYEY